MNTWGGPEDQEVLDDLMKEVPSIPSTPEQPQASSQSPAVTFQVPSTTSPVLSTPTIGSMSTMSDPDLGKMQERVMALKTGQPSTTTPEPKSRRRG